MLMKVAGVSIIEVQVYFQFFFKNNLSAKKEKILKELIRKSVKADTFTLANFSGSF